MHKPLGEMPSENTEARLRLKFTTSDESFLSLLEAAPDAMVLIDHDGTIILLNSQLERLFGWPR